MKKIIIMFSAVLMTVAIAGCKKNENTAQEKLPTVGIAKLLAHPALNSVEKGIQDELAAKGVKVNYDLQNANADMNIATSIANKFKSDGVNVTVGIGTPMAIALLNTLQNTPIVFAAISDPVAAHLVPSKDKGGKNITGVSDAVDIESQINAFRSIVPFIRLGMIYTSSEDNSVVMHKVTKEVCDKLGIKLISQPITNINEIKQAAESLIGRVDAFYVVTDNNVCSSLNSITSTASANNLPVFSADPSSSLQFGGVLYTAGADYYVIGRLAGQQIIDILNGKKTEDIPTRYMKGAKETQTIIDNDVVKALGVTIPQELISENTIFLENGKEVKK